LANRNAFAIGIDSQPFFRDAHYPCPPHQVKRLFIVLYRAAGCRDRDGFLCRVAPAVDDDFAVDDVGGKEFL
jgi:hypothetical protein